MFNRARVTRSVEICHTETTGTRGSFFQNYKKIQLPNQNKKCKQAYGTYVVSLSHAS
jgi:hypothetical protein